MSGHDFRLEAAVDSESVLPSGSVEQTRGAFVQIELRPRIIMLWTRAMSMENVSARESDGEKMTGAFGMGMGVHGASRCAWWLEFALTSVGASEVVRAIV